MRLLRPKRATLVDGRTVDVTIRLERTGAITGRIEDQHGDGLFGAQVQAIRMNDFGSHMKPTTAGPAATTDDRGHFRLHNLPAGNYYVVATYTRLHRRRETATRAGYARTYYPGSLSAREARPIAVRPGQDSASVNFTLASRDLAIVLINPVDSHGVALGPDAQLTLTALDDVYLSSSTSHATRRDDGRFVFEDVAPGNYYLVLTTSASMEEAAYVNMTIDGQDVSLRVQTNTGARISGRVIVNGPLSDPTIGALSPKVWLSANPPLEKYGPIYARVPLTESRETDRFELTGLRGPMVLAAEVAGGALVSIEQAGESIAGKTLEFAGTEVIKDVIVVLTTDVAALDVTVVGTTAPEAPEPIMVVLFSEDRARWHQGFLQYTSAMASRPPTSEASVARDASQPDSGVTQLRMSRMVPGRYLVIAFHDAGVSNPTDARMLEKLRPLAVPITLVAGQPTRVTSPVVKITR